MQIFWRRVILEYLPDCYFWHTDFSPYLTKSSASCLHSDVFDKPRCHSIAWVYVFTEVPPSVRFATLVALATTQPRPSCEKINILATQRQIANVDCPGVNLTNIICIDFFIQRRAVVWKHGLLHLNLNLKVSFTRRHAGYAPPLKIEEMIQSRLAARAPYLLGSDRHLALRS